MSQPEGVPERGEGSYLRGCREGQVADADKHCRWIREQHLYMYGEDPHTSKSTRFVAMTCQYDTTRGVDYQKLYRKWEAVLESIWDDRNFVTRRTRERNFRLACVMVWNDDDLYRRNTVLYFFLDFGTRRVPVDCLERGMERNRVGHNHDLPKCWAMFAPEELERDEFASYVFSRLPSSDSFVLGYEDCYKFNLEVFGDTDIVKGAKVLHPYL